MSLIDEAKAATVTKGPKGGIEALLAHPDLSDEDRDEITELLRAPTVGPTIAATVLTRHFGGTAGKRISQQMVRTWRLANL